MAVNAFASAASFFVSLDANETSTSIGANGGLFVRRRASTPAAASSSASKPASKSSSSKNRGSERGNDQSGTSWSVIAKLASVASPSLSFGTGNLQDDIWPEM